MIREFSVNKTKTNKKVQKFFQRLAQKMFRTAGLEFWNGYGPERTGPVVYRYRFHRWYADRCLSKTFKIVYHQNDERP